MRAFIGIDFSSELKKGILQLQNSLKPETITGRWKYSDNFHLTLKFLDEISETQASSIHKVMWEASQSNRAFSLKLSEAGYFPGKNSVRVLWLGLGGETGSLLKLQKEIENGLVPLGFEKEKRGFTPHVTIAQDLVFKRDIGDVIKELEFKTFTEIRVREIVLFKSEQIGPKRVYTPIKKFALSVKGYPVYLIK